MDQNLLTEGEVVEILKCSCASLRKSQSEGNGIPFFKIPGVGIRYGEKDVAHFIELHRVATHTGSGEE